MKDENTLVSGVALPLMQAVVSALLLSVGAYAVAGWLEAEQPFNLALGVFSVSSLLAWLLYRGEWRAAREALLGIGGSVASEPPAAPAINELLVHVVSERGMAGDTLSLPGVDRQQLETLARGLSAGRGLSVHEWSGIGRPFSRSQYENLRGQLLSRGFIRLRSENAPQLGYSLTGKGSALMRALSDIPSPLVSERARLERF